MEELKRFEEALESYDRALALRREHADTYLNRGIVLQNLLRLEEALASYDKALAIRADHPDANWNKSLLLLLTGQYLDGWRLYESRLSRDESRLEYHSFAQPAWRGQTDIAGQRLLIHGEQGFGDVIQFCRYVPLLKVTGARLILQVPKPLISLISTLDCPMTIVAKGAALPEFDAHCPIMSLPYALKTTLDTIPAEVPYLSCNPEKVAKWRDRLGESDRLKVGLAWSGAEKHKNDHNRSLQLDQLLGLTSLGSIEWHSLQKEYRSHDLEILNRHPEIQQHQDGLLDFSDTAALVECMDLVISVDTSVAHVAGALGKPLWILLPFIPDYRWLLDREDSPWYPSAKLYRQPKAGDWVSVIERIETDANYLAQRMRGACAAVKPKLDY